MLDDIRLRQLLDLENPQPYINLFTHVKEKKEFKFYGLRHKAIEVNDMTFDDVASVRKRLSKQKIEPDDIIYIFSKFFALRLPKWLYWGLRVTTFYPCYNFIINSIKKLAEAEQAHWTPENVDSDFKKAGSSNLSKFAEYSVAAEIAEKYGFKPSDIFEWKYSEVFIEVARNTAHSDVMRNYHEIKANKHK